MRAWMMRRLTADEHPQLWHLAVSQVNGRYVTACGLRYGIAGSARKSNVPAGACVKCLRSRAILRPAATSPNSMPE
jgi:hypothetical protein